MEDRVRKAILKLAGDDEKQAEELIALVDGTNEEIRDKNLIRREVAEPVVEPVLEPVAQVAEIEVSLDEQSLDTIVSKVKASVAESILGLQDQIETLRAELTNLHSATMQSSKTAEERFAKLEKSEDSKKEEWIADLPKRAKTKLNVTYRPSVEVTKTTEKDFASIASATLSTIK